VEAEREAGDVEAFPVFARLLRTASGTMQEAEPELARGDDLDAARLPASRALDELRLLGDAVREHRRQPEAPRDDQQDGQPQQGGAGNRDNAADVQALQLAVAQLGLLRTLQLQLEERTAKLEKQFSAGDVDAAAFGEASAKLAAEQRELAALAETLVKETELPPEEAVAPDLDDELQRSLEGDADRSTDEQGTK
jgi:hypothetical protein